MAEDTGKSGMRHPYRADLDGLRGVAVLLVILHHFFPGTWQGGFVGVDVFFVLSGYLITRILWDEINQSTFSFTAFFARRVRRLFPALIVVVGFVLAYGWATLSPEAYSLLGKHVFVSALFVSNFIYYLESGYFDQSAIGKSLLHLWSLSVEEQFYIAWPPLLLLIFRFRFGERRKVVVFSGRVPRGGVGAVGK